MAEMKKDDNKRLNIMLHPAEWRLIQRIRALHNGTLEIKISNGLPANDERAVEKVKYL